MYARGNVSKKLLLMVGNEKRDPTTVMKTNNNKLKGKLHEIETQNCTSDFDFCPKDPTNSPAEEKNKRKRKRKERSIMQLESTKKGVSAKSKTLKSKDKQVSSDKTKKSRSAPRKRTCYADLYEDEEARISVRNRASKLLARLEEETKLPSFVKCMLPSNVSHGFWLHLPKDFCTMNLPNEDSSVVLVDELGHEQTTSYLLGRHGLSAGWRSFALSHKLLKGDLLIFLLSDPCKFKVHIVRVNDIEVIVAALCLMSMCAASWTDADSEKSNKRKRKRNKYMDPFIFDFLMPSEDVEGRNTPKSSRPSADQSSSSDSYGFSSEVIEGSESTNQLKTEEHFSCM